MAVDALGTQIKPIGHFFPFAFFRLARHALLRSS
jgi:hypothetical protein